MLSSFDHSLPPAMADSIFSSSASAIVPDKQQQQQHNLHNQHSSSGGEFMCRVCHRAGSDVKILGCGCTLHAVS
jgi:hypothetical protein